MSKLPEDVLRATPTDEVEKQRITIPNFKIGGYGLEEKIV